MRVSVCLLALVLLGCRSGSTRDTVEQDAGATPRSPASSDPHPPASRLDETVSLASRRPLQRSAGPSPAADLDARVLDALTRGDRDALARLGTPDLDTAIATRLQKDLVSLHPEYLRSEQTPHALAVVHGLMLRSDGGAAIVHELVLVYVGPPSERKLARVINIGW